MCIRLAALSLLFSLSISASALADSGFRCASGRLVSVDDRMFEVRENCGEPDFIAHRSERRWTGQGCMDVVVEEWTYDMGRYNLVRTVIFVNGRVVDVEFGDYGKGGD